MSFYSKIKKRFSKCSKRPNPISEVVPSINYENFENEICECKNKTMNWQPTGIKTTAPGILKPFGELVKHHSGRFALQRKDGVLVTINQEWAAAQTPEAGQC